MLRIQGSEQEPNCRHFAKNFIEMQASSTMPNPFRLQATFEMTKLKSSSMFRYHLHPRCTNNEHSSLRYAAGWPILRIMSEKTLFHVNESSRILNKNFRLLLVTLSSQCAAVSTFRCLQTGLWHIQRLRSDFVRFTLPQRRKETKDSIYRKLVKIQLK